MNMDSVVHHNPSQSTLSPVSSSRKRVQRENETPAQRQKREKAAERQRRKRERDRHVNNLNAAMSYPQSSDNQPPSDTQPPPQAIINQDSPEETARKQRLRINARDRQRKHRAKQRKQRELGVEGPGETMPGIEEFRMNGHPEFPGFAPQMGHPLNIPISPFPPPPPITMTSAQNFAYTMIYWVMCCPAMKQYLNRMLSLSHEDIASLEPFVAQGFEQWEKHFGQQPAKTVDGPVPGPSAPPFPPGMTNPSANGFGEQQSSGADVDAIRARFQRPLVATPPFRAFNPPDETTEAPETPTSTPGSGPLSDPIDPHLSGGVTTEDGQQKAADADTDSVVG